MKKILLVAVLTFACSGLFAQEPVLLDGKARADVIASILKANDIRTSLQFSFVMTRYSALVTDRLESRGRASFVFPDKVRWEVLQPKASVFVLNGAAPGDRRQQTLLRNVSKISEKGLINEEDFQVTAYQAPGQWQVDLVPLRRDLSQLFTRITLLVDPSTGVLRSVVLNEVGGDMTTLDLSGITRGLPLDDNLFLQP